ncbi:MAG: hypothetical protein L0322_00715 [Chloroflexi bacterium]|nr:hypothetical protein [Chloroflexota bacterium]MCI0579208.1 hypothetical protein [Chloroflexota bacterium]
MKNQVVHDVLWGTLLVLLILGYRSAAGDPLTLNLTSRTANTGATQYIQPGGITNPTPQVDAATSVNAMPAGAATVVGSVEDSTPVTTSPAGLASPTAQLQNGVLVTTTLAGGPAIVGQSQNSVSTNTQPAGVLTSTTGTYYTGTFLFDANDDGTADDTLFYVLTNPNSATYDTLELSFGNQLFGQGAVNNGIVSSAGADDERVAAQGAVVRLGNSFYFTITYDTTPQSGTNDVIITATTWLTGTFLVDVDDNGVTEAVNFALSDINSDGVYSTLDLSLNGMYGQGNLTDVTVNTGNDERVSASPINLFLGDTLRFQVAFDTNPGLDMNDARVTAGTWFTGAFQVDVDDDGATEVVNFVFSDANSDGVYYTLDLSLDGTYGQGNLTDLTVNTGNDERVNSSPANLTLGSTLSFQIAFDNDPGGDATDAEATAETWFTGNITLDVDGDGSADDVAYYALSDTNSNGMYDTLDLSTDNQVFGQGSLSNDETGPGDDERWTGTAAQEIEMDVYHFDVAFNDTPAGGDGDVTLTTTTWFFGSNAVLLEGSPVYDAALADANSDGVYEAVYIDFTNDGDFNDPADVGPLAVDDPFGHTSLDLQYAIRAVAATGDGFELQPQDASLGATPAWYVGPVALDVGSVVVAVSDQDGDTTYDRVDFDGDNDKVVELIGYQENDLVTLGGQPYLISDIADDGSDVTLTPSQVAFALGPQNPSPASHGVAAQDVEMLQLQLSAGPAEGVLVESLTLQAGGSGHDSNHIAAVGLYVDNGQGGVFEPGVDTLIDTGSYPADNGNLTLAFNQVIAAGSQQQWLVVYDFNGAAGEGDTFFVRATDAAVSGTISGASLVPAGLPLTGPAMTLRRYTALLPLTLRDYYGPPRNGGFELGNFTYWQTGGLLGRAVVGQLDPDGQTGNQLLPPIAGVYSAELGNPVYVNSGGVPVGYAEIRQTFSLPAGQPTLTFRYWVFTHDLIYSQTQAAYYDTLEVFVNSVDYAGRRDDLCRFGGTWVPTEGDGLILCDGNPTQNPTRDNPPYDSGLQIASFTFNPGDYAGSNVTLIFQVHNRIDGYYNTWVYLDSVTLSP